MNKEVNRLGHKSANTQAESKRTSASLIKLEADTDRNMCLFKDRLHTMEVTEKEVKIL